MSHPEIKNTVNSIIIQPTFADLVHVRIMAGSVESRYKESLSPLSLDHEKELQ